jgi:pimeloyl-ACP methyl ester carboxylesterase
MYRILNLLRTLTMASNSAAPSSTSLPTKSSTLSAYAKLAHAPHATKPSNANPITIKVDDSQDGAVPGILHLPPESEAATPSSTAAILLSGAGGGIVGPSGIYLSLADKLPCMSHPIPVLRLDYRFPARNKYCVRDVLAAMDYLEQQHRIANFVLVGWSFGGAPVFTVGGMDQRVAGCATVASQTAETGGIRQLSPRPVLLLHGAGDRTLSPSCSERLFAMYGGKGDRVLKLFDGDDHALTTNSLEAEVAIGEFVMKCARIGLEAGDREILGVEAVEQNEKVDVMRKGGDLKNESVE